MTDGDGARAGVAPDAAETQAREGEGGGRERKEGEHSVRDRIAFQKWGLRDYGIRSEFVQPFYVYGHVQE